MEHRDVLANITNGKVKDAYKSAYDTAIERLSDPDYYPPSAGTPAAKIISVFSNKLIDIFNSTTGNRGICLTNEADPKVHFVTNSDSRDGSG